jgi:ubiquinone/menaquinone biosynthesis C-methylase UbiE
LVKSVDTHYALLKEHGLLSTGIHLGWTEVMRGDFDRRVGPSGQVIGVDVDPVQLRGARAFVADDKLANVEILAADAYASSLPDNSFDLAHVRFLFAPVGRDAQLMNEL